MKLDDSATTQKLNRPTKPTRSAEENPYRGFRVQSQQCRAYRAQNRQKQGGC